MAKLNLLTYANAPFEQAQRMIVAEAAAFPFDYLRAVREKDLAGSDFWRTHGDFIKSHPRGGGYWLWKSYLVMLTLDNMADGDILVYADSGCKLNAANLPRFAEYVAAVAAHPSGVLAFEMGFLQRHWTKRATIEALERRGPVDLEAGQLVATCFMLRAGPETRALASAWYEICSDYNLLDDSPSRDASGAVLPEDPTFREHRHDQAIWSMLVRQYRVPIENDAKDPQFIGALLFPDETVRPIGPIIAARRR